MSDKRRLTLAQNFLTNAATAHALVREARVQSGDHVYDLGTGTGILTRALLAAAARVTAVEKDANLARRLREDFASTRVTIVEADLADVRFAAPYKVVANIPFNRTAVVLRRLFLTPPHPDEAVLVIQREAAEKYACHGRHSAMSLIVLPWFEMRIAGAIPCAAFVPRPAVDVAVLHASLRRTSLLPMAERALWTSLVRYAFARCRADARGTFRNLLSNLQWRLLSNDLGIERDARLRDLQFKQWLSLFAFVRRHAPTRKLKRMTEFIF